MTQSWLAGRYQLLEALGKGGFAQTYLAIDHHQQQRRCVIKHLLPTNSAPEFLATARRLFQAEVEVLRRLGSHDRIPQLIDALEIDGEFYLVQEYIEGDTLSTLFKQQGTFTQTETVNLLREILSVLAFVHAEQVIHRDIKPSNIMRRAADGKLMLIDFGAVKEITTELYTAHSEQFTVSIGTQGYAAPEQMAGRPRYSSDLYALGMTVIRGMTGRSPTEFSDNPQTGELQWAAAAPNISPGLRTFLQRLTQPSIYQRYRSATEALTALTRCEHLTTPAAPDIPETVMNEASPLAGASQRRRWQRRRWQRGLLAPLLVTGLVLAVRQLGGWMPLEMRIHDVWVRQQPSPPVDDRLLVVEITEADLQALQQPTPSDAVLAQTVQTLQAYDPAVIGVDLYRDLPQGQGHEQLVSALSADNVIAIRQLGNSESAAVPGPPGVPSNRVGFNDFPIDDDGVVRRNLLLASSDRSPTTEITYSFALRLVLAYLQPLNIVPLGSDRNPNYLNLNGTTFVPLHKHFGAYRRIDDAGYQVMMQYQGATDAFPTVPLMTVLEGKVAEAQVRDRIVLIGTTAASAKDFFFTPYSSTADKDFLMPGVMLHAHATSQLLRATLDQQRLYWEISEIGELVWIVLWAVAGISLGQSARRLWLWGLGLAAGLGIVIGTAALVMNLSGWLPLLPASVAFAGTAITAALSRNHTAPTDTLKE